MNPIKSVVCRINIISSKRFFLIQIRVHKWKKEGTRLKSSISLCISIRDIVKQNKISLLLKKFLQKEKKINCGFKKRSLWKPRILKDYNIFLFWKILGSSRSALVSSRKPKTSPSKNVQGKHFSCASLENEWKWLRLTLNVGLILVW